MVVKTSGNGKWQRWILGIMLTIICGLVTLGYNDIKGDITDNTSSINSNGIFFDSLRIYMAEQRIMDSVIRADLVLIKGKIGDSP